MEHEDREPIALERDNDSPTKRCRLSRLLREEGASKRQRFGSTEAEEERVRVLHESQESALEGARKTTQVATLLGVPWGEQHVRFLKLHPCTPKKIDLKDVLRNAAETTLSLASRRQEILVAKNRLTDAIPNLYVGMQAALHFLGHRWPLHSSAGQYAIELAPNEWVQDIMPRALVRVANNPKRGVCLSFPWEMSQIIQPRRQLFITFRSKTFGGGSSKHNSASNYELMPRPEALHHALLEAQGLLLDASVFERFRQVVLTSERHRLPRPRSFCEWTLYRVGLSEVTFLVAKLHDYRGTKPWSSRFFSHEFTRKTRKKKHMIRSYSIGKKSKWLRILRLFWISMRCWKWHWA